MTKLYSRIRGEGFPVLILHGLFGSSDNLGSVATALASKFKTHAIDLRNHGRSFHREEMNYELMAEDVIEYMNDQGIDIAYVLGHSMGGKVAMSLALHQQKRIKAVIVADISPVRYEGHHDEIFAGLFALLESNIVSRKEADSLLAEFVPEQGVRQFLLKNLKAKPGGGFDLKVNLNAIHQNYHHILDGQHAEKPFLGEVLFIAGEASDYIQAAHKEKVVSLFPFAKVRIIPKASHWLHAEKPETFIGICERFLTGID